jgi:hypothetical protein
MNLQRHFILSFLEFVSRSSYLRCGNPIRLADANQLG